MILSCLIINIIRDIFD